MSVINFNPNFVNSGNMARKVIELTFANWDYRLKITMELGGNVMGLDAIDCVIENYLDSISEEVYCGDYYDYVAEIILTRESDSDTLIVSDIGVDELKDMLIKAEIVVYEPIKTHTAP